MRAMLTIFILATMASGCAETIKAVELSKEGRICVPNCQVNFSTCIRRDSQTPIPGSAFSECKSTYEACLDMCLNG